MTEDQIKAIAEKIVDGDTLHIKGYELKPEVTVPIIEDAIEQLLKRYCIAEREKVMDAFNTNRQWREDCLNSIEDERFDACRAEGAIDTIYHLLGTSMFNENE